MPDETGYVSCPYCEDPVVERVKEKTFHCSSCDKTFTADGYAMFTERPP